MKKLVLLIPFLYSSYFFSQEVKLNYNEQPINEILIDLSAKYNVQLSINSSSSNTCQLAINQTFTSLDEAFKFIASACNLEIQKVGGIYSFKTATNLPKVVKKEQYLFQGLVSDKIDKEPLPYAKVKFNGQAISCDENGRYSFYSEQDKTQTTFIYLGYFTLDTLLSKNTNISIQLDYQMNSLETVEILQQQKKETFFQTVGEKSGLYTFNNIASNLIPSNNDLLFNLLRLYPGVNASSELSSEAIIWGSYPGQTQTIFDGITLFNSSGMNENVGRLNPFFIKNIELYKGCYNVNVGDRIGSITLISGKDGNKDSSSFKVAVNNQIANLYYNQPLKKINSSLQFGLRKSYFQLFDYSTIFKSNLNKNYPNYSYQDFNLKWNTNFKNNDRLEVSLITSSDDYKERINEKKNPYYSNIGVNSKQYGGAISYYKSWYKRGISKVTATSSEFLPNYLNQSDIKSSLDTIQSSYYLENSISESSVKIEHQFSNRKRFNLLIGTGYIQNNYNYLLKNQEILVSNKTETKHTRISSFAKNTFQLKDRLTISTGVKMDLLMNNSSVYLQPRINFKLKLFTSFHMNGGWGIYNQFIEKALVKDEFGSKTYFWQTVQANSNDVPKSIHQQLSFVYAKSNLEILVEGYIKQSSNLTSYYTDNSNNFEELNGNSNALGIDFFIKKKFKKHQYLIAYSLGKIDEETLSESSKYSSLAPQNQFQELKGGLFLSFNKWKFSFTEVIGSGFENGTIKKASPYHRFDFAFNYKLLKTKWDIDLGISILNVFNNQNVRFNQFSSLPELSENSIFAIPFTPTINLTIGLR